MATCLVSMLATLGCGSSDTKTVTVERTPAATAPTLDDVSEQVKTIFTNTHNVEVQHAYCHDRGAGYYTCLVAYMAPLGGGGYTSGSADVSARLDSSGRVQVTSR